MPDANEAILATCVAVLNGEQSADPREGYCLSFVRDIVEHSQGWPWGKLYSDYVTQEADPAGHRAQDGPWARDAEKSLRELGMAVHLEDAQPGDLLFIWRDAWSKTWNAYVGHVGILLPGALVLENVKPDYRPHSFHRGEIQLTPRKLWFAPSTVIRFDPEKKAT